MTADASEHEPTRAVQVINLGVLRLTSEVQDGVHTVALSGELDLASAPEVEEALKRAEATDARAIVLDLSELSFIDSTGIRLVLGAHARSQSGGAALTLRRGPAAVQRVFEISGLSERVPFAD